MTRDQWDALQGEALARGYGRIFIGKNGRPRSVKTPQKRDPEFEARVKKLAPEIIAYNPTPTDSLRRADAQAAAQQQPPDFLTQLGQSVNPVHQFQQLPGSPTEKAMALTSLLPGVGEMGLLSEMALYGGEGAVGGYLEGGKERAKQLGIEGLTMGPIGRGVGWAAKAPGWLLKFAGRKATRMLVAADDMSRINAYLAKLFNRDGHEKTAQDILKYGWYKVFKRPQVIEREGAAYEATMNALESHLQQTAQEKQQALKEAQSRIKLWYQAMRKQGQKLQPQQIRQISQAFRAMRKDAGDAMTAAKTFGANLKEATSLRKRAFPYGLPDDSSDTLKPGGAAYDAYQRYQALVQQMEDNLNKYAGGQHAVDLFKEAKQLYARTSGMMDLAKTPGLADRIGVGKDIFNTDIFHEALTGNEASLRRRLGDDVWEDLQGFAGRGLPPEAGGDLPASGTITGGLSARMGVPHPYVHIRPGERFVPEFAGNPPRSIRTMLGEELPGAARAATRTAVPAAGAALSDLGGSQQMTPEQQKQLNDILAKYRVKGSQ